MRKATSGVARAAKKVASNPRRTVRQAADNVHQTAARARGVGESVVTAGEMIKQTADMVDSMAQRAKERTTQGAAGRKRGSGGSRG
jgi:methyl-accepting chemotaxis protein